MNHRGAKRKRANDDLHQTMGCLVLLKITFTCGLILWLFWWLFPIANLGIHYLQWKSHNIVQYEFYFSEAGIILPEGSTEHIYHDALNEDGTVHHIELSRVFIKGYEPIDTVFQTALSRIWNPFLRRCSVGYDENYGFLSAISCGSLQREHGGWWWVKHFQPITNDE